MFLDMLFIYSQFIDDLPESFQEFKTKWLDMFPKIYDTKCIATSLAIFPKTDLKFMAQQFLSSKKFCSLL